MTTTTVRVGSNGKVSVYVGEVLQAVSVEGTATVRIRGAGKAIAKAVSVAEIVKRKSARPLH
jgi:DNA-binding protein Alba